MFKFLTDLGVTSDSPHFFLAHPAQVSRWLDEVWLFGPQQLQFQELPPPDGTGVLRVLQPFLGDAGVVTSLGAPDPLIDPAGLALTAGKLVLPPGFNEASQSVLVGKLPIWHHLIYAYLLENTGMFEIFAEVVRRATSGETLEISGQPAVQWVRNTEELFFRDPPLFSVGSITSHIRPDERSVRRNAYWRMFGMDLPTTSRRGGAAAREWQAWKPMSAPASTRRSARSGRSCSARCGSATRTARTRRAPTPPTTPTCCCCAMRSATC